MYLERGEIASRESPIEFLLVRPGDSFTSLMDALVKMCENENRRINRSVKITNWETFSDSKAAFLLVKVTDVNTGEVVDGLGEFGGKDIDMTLELFYRRFIPALVNVTIDSPLDLFNIITSFEFNYKMMGVQFSKALCGVDSALWDAYAKFENKTVAELISSKPIAEVEIYASSINRSCESETLINEIRRLGEQHGIRAFKIKLGQRMKEAKSMDRQDIETLESILQLFPDRKIAIDCNGAYKNIESISSLFNMTEQLWFLEEPFPWFHYSSYRDLGEVGYRPLLAGGEQEFRRDVWSFVASLFDIAQPDIGYSGGFTELLLISKYHKRIIPHSPQADLMPLMALHFMNTVSQEEKLVEFGCVRDGLVQADIDDYGNFRPRYFNECLQVRDGKLSLKSSKSGWGVSLSHEWKSSAKYFHYQDNHDKQRSFL